MVETITLSINELRVAYHDSVEVLNGVSIKAEKQQVVALLGKNGAGKSTTLKSISGLLRTENGRVTEGTVTFEGEAVENSSLEHMTSKGVIQVIQGRQAFRKLTVEENLKAGTANRLKKSFENDLKRVYTYFPALHARRKTPSGDCSAAELQMLSIARALMAHPVLLILDEPSTGLAPLLVTRIFQTLSRINQELGMTMLMAEQKAEIALRIAHFGYVMENGRIVMESDGESLRRDPDFREFFLGPASAGAMEPPGREKLYKYRKRWL